MSKVNACEPGAASAGMSSQMNGGVMLPGHQLARGATDAARRPPRILETVVEASTVGIVQSVAQVGSPSPQRFDLQRRR